jgi:hypothetical protein
MQAIVRERLTEVAVLCRSLGVRRLDLFGSAARDDFGPNSDVDFLVTLDPLQQDGYAQRYFDLKDGLERIFDRPVDLLTEGSVRNPYLRAHIRAGSVRVFEA